MANGNLLTGWRPIYNGLLASEAWITYNDSTGRFTLSKPEVYQISSSVQLCPDHNLNPEYNMTQQSSHDLYVYSLSLTFYKLEGTPNVLSVPDIGFIRLANVQINSHSYNRL